MAEIRSPKGNELQEVIGFLDGQLRHKEGWSILNEYPVAFNRHNIDNIRVLFEDGKIVSHAVIKNLIVKTPMAIFKVAAIGSVVTDPEFRLKGYSQRVIEDCILQAEKQDADIAILWSDLYDYYRKYDFELAGTEIALIINNELDAEPSGLKIVKSNKVDPNALLKLYTQHSIGSMRTTGDVFNYLQIPNCQLYTAWDEANNLQAYAVEGRGADLENYIHEWGGGVSAVMPLLSHIRKEKNAPITVICPNTSQNLIRQIKEQGAYTNNGFLGMIKLINTKNLFFKIHRYARFIGQQDFILEYNGQDYIVGHSGHIFRTSSEKDIVRLIFGPKETANLENFDEETRNIISAVLPVPMWIWGWDSV